MNKGRIWIIALGLIIAIGLGYLVYTMIVQPKVEYTFIMLNNQITENYIDKVVSESVGNLQGQGKDISIRIHPSQGEVFDFILEEPAIFAVSINNDKILKDTLLHFSGRHKKFDVGDAMVQIETMINYITNQSDNSYNKIYLIGSFPECFSTKESEAINELMNKKFQNLNNENYEINWIVKSNEKEPEQLILTNLQNNNIKVNNLEISSVPRICNEHSFKDIYSIFFKKLNDDQLSSMLAKMQQEYKDDLRLTIWNSGILNNKIVELKGDSLDNFRPLFAQLEDGEWTSIGFLLNQAAISLKQLPDSVDKELIIIGNLPSESKGILLNTKVWELYSQIQNLKIKFYLPQGSKETLTDKALINGVKKQYGIEIQKVSF